MKAKNLIIGVIRGYRFDDIRSFVASLSRLNFQGDVVLLAAGITGETAEQLMHSGIRVIPFRYRKKSGSMNSWARFWPRLKPWQHFLPKPIARTLMKEILHLMDVRHFHVKDFLLRHPTPHDEVFVTDVRDVLFQADPFSVPAAAEMEIYQEGKLIRECPINSHWIKERFGEEALSLCADKPVHCFGTIRGTRRALIRFFDHYEDCCREVLDYASGPGDQGTFNWMLSREKLPEFVASIPNFTGSVATLGSTPMASIPMSGDKTAIHSISGKIIPVVHQYDRFPEISERLLSAIVPQ